MAYIGYSLYHREWLLRPEEVDLHTGVRPYDANDVDSEEVKREPGFKGWIKHVWTD